MLISDWSSDVCSSDLSEYHSASGEVLRRILPQAEPFPLSWPPYNTFLQPELERLLRESFDRYDRLETLLGWRAVSFAQNEGEATVTIESVSDGERSEEHTSELQSLMRISYAVFCLKKNKEQLYTHDRVQRKI